MIQSIYIWALALPLALPGMAQETEARIQQYSGLGMQQTMKLAVRYWRPDGARPRHFHFQKCFYRL